MKGINKVQQGLFFIMAFIFVVLAGFLIYREYNYNNNNAGNETGLLNNGSTTYADNVHTDGTTDEGAFIKVYITGQVKNPGVISIQEGSRLADVIELAGGALPDADLNRVNLAIKVQDEGMYYILAKGEEAPSGVEDPVNGGINNNGKININKADQSQLETLNGIGAARAKMIIDYREKNGNFNSIEEIMNISGIGQKIFEGLKDQITVD